VASLSSCLPPIQDPPPDPRVFEPPDKDLHDVGSALPYFVDFMYAMEKTHLIYLLEEEGPYTVFMPVQASFSEFHLKNKINHIDQMPADELAEILSYHFIPGRWMISNIPEGYHPTLALEKTSGNPIDIYIVKHGIFYLNGQNILDTPDLQTANGYIQSITSVLSIPALLDHLAFNDDFSLILEMLKRNNGETDFAQLLSGEGPFTFLAPDNTAIRSYLKNNSAWQTIEDIPGQAVVEILHNHLVKDINIVFEKTDGEQNITMLSGNSYIVQREYPKWLIKDEQQNLARINIRNIQGTNGIIHQIDRILLP
jgi:uncharacterized surface protein with fasciclin (FAS1) repeats